MTERVLNYDHSITPQETYYDCGPASTQVVLNGRGIIESEQTLIGALGTTTDGTSDVDVIFPVLNGYLGGGYRTSHIPDDPPSDADRAALWSCVKGSIDAGFGVIANIVVPPSNYPRGIRGSESPAYAGGTVYHYIALMGYNDDNPNEIAIWVADSGFRPYGYWVSLDQLVTMIAPKGYCFYSGSPQPTPPGGNTMADTFYADVSEFQCPVDDSYPDPVISIRSNDGTYQDHNFAQNYRWCVNAANSGKITGFIVYAYWRPNWQETAQTMIDMVNAQGGPHPKMAAMIDVESGGNPGGDQSDGINGMYDMLARWLGNPARVCGYANSGDFFSMWQTRPANLRMHGAGYGSNPNLPGQIAHQYTDGVYGASQGLKMGDPPFGNCDMNVADGLTPDQWAQALGLAPATPPPNVINEFAKVSPWIGKRLNPVGDTDENICPDGIGRWVEFEKAHVYWTPTTGAHGIPKNIFDKWASQKWETGPLGYPTDNVYNLANGNAQAFQGGMIYQENGKDACIVHGAIGNHWAQQGFENGPMGWPTSDEYPYDQHGSIAQNFEHGTLVWNPNNVIEIQLPSGAKTNVPDVTTK